MSKRIERVNELIRREISQIILREVEFPQNVLVTVTRAESTLNLIEARVFISVMPDAKAVLVLNILNKKIFGLQQEINKRLKMRPTPKIIFKLEKITDQADRVEKLLEKIKNEE